MIFVLFTSTHTHIIRNVSTHVRHAEIHKCTYNLAYNIIGLKVGLHVYAWRRVHTAAHTLKQIYEPSRTFPRIGIWT